MRVVCDNCGATYKIPEHKLVKEVNKATCRKCGHRLLIRRPSTNAAPAPVPTPAQNDEETRLTRSVLDAIALRRSPDLPLEELVLQDHLRPALPGV